MPIREVAIPPEISVRWQELVDLLAGLAQVPSALVVQADAEKLSVITASDSPGNPFAAGESVRVGSRVYCEGVLENLEPLHIEDARKDEHWRSSLDLELGLVSYLGIPLLWPDGSAFGTLCLLDVRPNAFGSLYLRLMRQLRGLIEADLRSIAPIDPARACDADPTMAREREAVEREASLSDALRESEECFRTVFTHAVMGMAIVAPDGRLVRANRALCEMLGWKEEELVGVHHEELTYPPDVEQCQELLRGLLAGEVDSVREEKRYVHKNGQIIWAELSIGLVRDSAGRPAYFVVNIQDVTERRRIQAHRIEANRLEAIGRLAGGIAHDFNNLLTVISGYCGLMLHRLNPADPLYVDAQEIRAAADTAASLTRQLLAFSRRQILQPRVLDLNIVVERMERMLARLVGEDIEFVLRLGPDVGPVSADEGQLEQVLANLVVNAREAMPDGGTLTIETASVTAELEDGAGGSAPARCAMVVIRDTGRGLDADALAHIFEPFFTTKEPGRGTGLGLASVYGIIKQSGGSIRVESEPGHGTTFTVLLPEVARSEPGRRRERRQGQSAAAATTILLVEDTDDVRRLAALVLDEEGFKVVEARSGVDALRAVERLADVPDIVITDVVMPRMSGPKLVAELRAKHPGLRALFMSGYASDAINSKALAERGDGFIAKPFSPDELVSKVREVLDTGR